MTQRLLRILKENERQDWMATHMQKLMSPAFLWLPAIIRTNFECLHPEALLPQAPTAAGKRHEPNYRICFGQPEKPRFASEVTPS